jgi:YVTN family beta-propeller protein
MTSLIHVADSPITGSVGYVYSILAEEKQLVGKPIVIGQFPTGLAATSDGTKLLVADNSAITAKVLSVESRTVLGTITLTGTADPIGVAIPAGYTHGFITDTDNNTVIIVDMLAYSVITTISVGNSPDFICASPDGSKLWVSNVGANSISVIDPSSNTVIHTITGLVDSPGGACVTPDSSTLWVSIDTDIYPIDTTSYVVGSPISLGTFSAEHLFIKSDGSEAYVSGQDTVPSVGIVPVSLPSGPAGTEVSFDQGAVGGVPIAGIDATAFITNGQVLVASLPTGPVGTPIDVEDEQAQQGITEAVTPTGAFLAGFALTVDYAEATLSIPGATVDLDGSYDVSVDYAEATLLVGIEHDKAVTTTIVAGDPGPRGFASFLTPMPPVPVPGPYGNHDYEVVVCDKYGVAFGVIPTAIPTEIDYELDSIGQCLIDFWIQDPLAPNLLPISSIPGVREIQIWRDQVLIWWGWPTSATWDTTTVHLTCSGLLWVLGQREMGPNHLYYLANTQFEEGLDFWTANDVTATPETTTVVLGKGAARLVQPLALQDSYLFQDVAIDLTDQAAGLAFALSAWVYVDGNYAYTGTALNQRGLWVNDQDGNNYFCTLPSTTPENTWTRIELQPTGEDPAFIIPPGVVTTLEIRLYCPGGSVVWDAVNLSVYENISSPPSSPPATAWDVADIIETLLISAQQNVWTQSELAFFFYGAATGVFLNRVYLIDTQEIYLDAINEFPSIGVCDFEMVWDATGHFRGLQIYTPAKGSVKYSAVIDPGVNVTTQLAGSVDGTQTRSKQLYLGQGSTGPAQDTGFAAFASYLGGRVVTDAVITQNSDIVASATAAFTSEDVGINCYSLHGGFVPGTYIVSVTSSTEVVISSLALLNLTGETFGVGGITLDKSTAALPNQPISTLQQSAQAFLFQSMKTEALPAPRIRADGPNGLFGQIEVGDVVVANSDYGWLQYGPTLTRVSKLILYPPTEELEPTLMPLNTPVSPE